MLFINTYIIHFFNIIFYCLLDSVSYRTLDIAGRLLLRHSHGGSHVGLWQIGDAIHLGDDSKLQCWYFLTNNL